MTEYVDDLTAMFKKKRCKIISAQCMNYFKDVFQFYFELF